MSELRPYPVHEVDRTLAEEYESMGSKTKFWLRRPADQSRWLFKYSRRITTSSTIVPAAPAVPAYTGEHWAEKIAAEIAGALGIPHAVVELAQEQRSNRPGAMVRDVKPTSRETLVHGNELLMRQDPSYPSGQKYQARAYTLDNVFFALSEPTIGLPAGFDLPEEIRTAVDVFVGYLLLDALIGNTDRHHENWALIRFLGGTRVLAPSYDHASSMGRDLSESQQEKRLSTRDHRATVAAYARKARSALYRVPQDETPMSTFDAFATAAARRPDAARTWRSRVHAVSDDVLGTIVTRVPDQVMSKTAQRFVVRFLQYTRQQILDLDLG